MNGCTNTGDFVCPICGKSFFAPSNSSKVYCSPECRAKASRTRKPRRTAEEMYAVRHEESRQRWEAIMSVARAGKSRGLSYGQEMARRKDLGK